MLGGGNNYSIMRSAPPIGVTRDKLPLYTKFPPCMLYMNLSALGDLGNLSLDWYIHKRGRKGPHFRYPLKNGPHFRSDAYISVIR